MQVCLCLPDFEIVFPVCVCRLSFLSQPQGQALQSSLLKQTHTCVCMCVLSLSTKHTHTHTQIQPEEQPSNDKSVFANAEAVLFVIDAQDELPPAISRLVLLQ